MISLCRRGLDLGRQLLGAFCVGNAEAGEVQISAEQLCYQLAILTIQGLDHLVHHDHLTRQIYRFIVGHALKFIDAIGVAKLLELTLIGRLGLHQLLRILHLDAVQHGLGLRKIPIHRFLV